MSLHIEPTEEAVETLRKERRKNYIAALATSILSVVLAGAILYSLTIIIAAPEEPKVVGYITPDDAPPSDTPPPPEVQRETSSPMRKLRQGSGGSCGSPGEPAQDRRWPSRRPRRWKKGTCSA
ncbi:hypothetical protein [Akkermansia sp.]|uniref:hypothetical protein n=1 Tax=Akkermansia sp. TaxID=1872421 RepID=UPI0039944BFC